MNTKELAKALQGIIEGKFEIKTNGEKSREVLDELVAVITDTLAKGDKADIIGLGKLEAVERAERNGVNPATQEKIIIPASIAPKFKPAKVLKDKLNGK